MTNRLRTFSPLLIREAFAANFCFLLFHFCDSPVQTKPRLAPTAPALGINRSTAETESQLRSTIDSGNSQAMGTTVDGRCETVQVDGIHQQQ